MARRPERNEEVVLTREELKELQNRLAGAPTDFVGVAGHRVNVTQQQANQP